MDLPSRAVVAPEVARMASQIVDGFNPELIVLFGSRARHMERLDSDVDLLVVMSVTGSRREAANAIDRLLDDRTLPVDVVVVTPEQFARDRHLRGTLVQPAITEGVVLYERVA